MTSESGKGVRPSISRQPVREGTREARSISLVIQFCDINPAAVECESTRFASGILDPDDAGTLSACMLDNVEPVISPVLTCALELGARQPDRAIVKAPGHRLDFAPAIG